VKKEEKRSPAQGREEKRREEKRTKAKQGKT